MKITDYFYRSSQAAKLLGVTRITIWRWIKANKFDVEYIGNEALIPKWQIDSIISGKRVNTAEARLRQAEAWQREAEAYLRHAQAQASEARQRLQRHKSEAGIKNG